MLAARLWARRDVRVEDVEDPGSPAAGWVRVRIDACGICGTDVEEFSAGPLVVPIEPHPLSGRCTPLTLGHEAVGVIEERGAGSAIDAGTRVAVEGNLFCGTCWWCRRHEHQLCEQLAGLGLMADGGLAEIMLAPAHMCIPVSDGIDPGSASLAEPLSVAVRAVRRGGIGLGDTVGVVGAGTVGLLAIQVARLVGASTVVSVEPILRRRQLAVELGADVAVAPADATEATLELTHGRGPDTVIEAAGDSEAAALAVRLTRRGGRAVLLGVFDGTVPLDTLDFVLGEKNVVASLSHVYDTDFTSAVRLIDTDAVRTAPLITDRIRLVDVIEQGFESLLTRPADHLKIVVVPNGDPAP